MKKKIFLRIILIIELVILVIFGLGKINTSIQTLPVFNYIFIAGQWFYSLMKQINAGIKLDNVYQAMFKANMPNLNAIITLVLFNLVFVGVYYLIFGTLTVIINKYEEKKIRKVVTPYTLTSNEYDKFNYKHYLNKFPIRRVISMIIPIGLLLILIFARFDKTVCFEANSKLSGGLNFYTNTIEPFFSKIFAPKDFHAWMMKVMTRSNGHGYIDLMNNIFGNFTWVEYIVIVADAILVFAAWYILFSIIHLMVRNSYAKHKANKAREAYIRKMELIEYKLYNKYKDETNIKADDFMHIVENEQQAAAKEIAKFKQDVDSEEALEAKNSEENRKAYYEDIGQGVTDLGVSDDQVDMSKPIIEREVKYISDEEVDIILDEEPVIEVVEDEQEEADIEFGKNDIFFEKYQPDDIEIKTIEEYSGEEYKPEEHTEIKEEPIKEEDPVEEKPLEEASKQDEVAPNEIETVEAKQEEATNEPPLVDDNNNSSPLENPIEENIASANKQEEIAKEQEAAKPSEEVTYSDVKEDTEFSNNEAIVQDPEASSEALAEEEKPAEVQPHPIEIEEVNPYNEEPVEEKPTNSRINSAFAKYIGRRNEKGYGAKKVPTFKELKEIEESKEEEKK